MADAADFRQFALSWPEAREDTHRGKPAFRVAGKIFGLLSEPGGQGFMGLDADQAAVIKMDRHDQLAFCAILPDAVMQTSRYGHHGWTYLRLHDLAQGELATLVGLAWAHVAPKRLVKGLARS